MLRARLLIFQTAAMYSKLGPMYLNTKLNTSDMNALKDDRLTPIHLTYVLNRKPVNA